MTRPSQITPAQWTNILAGGSNGEKALLLMANLADRQRVREIGTNRGFWVERFLAAAGLGPGYPWCAAALTWTCDQLEIDRPPKGAAAVRNWVTWGIATGRHLPISQVQRGDLVYWLNRDGTGHIGIVSHVAGSIVFTIEGNTSSGERGSQRDGDGLYRRDRHIKAWHGVIRL